MTLPINSAGVPFGPLSYSVVLNGSGYGFVRIAPAGNSWDIQRVTVRVVTAAGLPSTTLEAVCTVYRGQIALANVVDTTGSGSTGSTSDTIHHLDDGNPIFVEWRGGDAGATAVVTISGIQSSPLGGFRSTPPQGGFRAVR